MLDLPSTLVLSCLMAILSSKNRLRCIVKTSSTCLVYVLGLAFALGLIRTTYDRFNSLTAKFAWTLEFYETIICYLFIVMGFTSLSFFSFGGLDSGLDNDEDVLTDVDNDVSPEPRLPDDGNHHTTTQQHEKAQNMVNTVVLTVDTLSLRRPLGGRNVSRRRVSQDFTINRAMKRMKIVHPSAFLNTLTPNPKVLKQVPEVRRPNLTTNHTHSTVSTAITKLTAMEPAPPDTMALPDTTVANTMTLQGDLKDGQARVSSAGAKKQNNDPCTIEQEQHKARTVPNTIVLNIAALQNQPKDQSIRHAKHPLDDPSSRKLSRLLLKDFLALKAGTKIPSLEESVFISAIDTYAQVKSRAINKVSESSTSESVCSRLSGESYFQAGFRVIMSSKSGLSRKRLARSTLESGLLTPESEFQAGLRATMQATCEKRKTRSGASTSGSVSSSTSEESSFQSEFRKVMWPSWEIPAESRRSSRPSTPESDSSSQESEIRAELYESKGSRHGVQGIT